MGKRILLLVALAMITVGCSNATGGEVEPDWALKGTWSDACCCKVSCPCLFGSKPTEGYCEGASLLEIESGHYGEVALDGTAAVAAYRVRGWTRIVVSDAATEEQAKALAAVLPKAFPFLGMGALDEVGRAPLTVERTANSVKYSVPETSVEIALVESANGEPITLQNVPAKGTPFPQAHDHTQYKSQLLKHQSKDQSFEWSGRNGFVSQFDLSSAADDDS